MSARTPVGPRSIMQCDNISNSKQSFQTLESGHNIQIKTAISEDATTLKKGYTIETEHYNISDLDWVISASSAARVELGGLFEDVPIPIEDFEGANVETQLHTNENHLDVKLREDSAIDEEKALEHGANISIETRDGMVTAVVEGSGCCLDTFQFKRVENGDNKDNGNPPLCLSHTNYMQHSGTNIEKELVRRMGHVPAIETKLEEQGYRLQRRPLSYTVVWTKDELVTGC